MAHNGKASEDHGYEGIDVMIEIKVKTMDSRTHNLRISNQRKVRNLKEDIALLIGMPVEQQRLIYCGKFLKDDQLISSYNVQHGDTLHLVCNVPSMSSDGSSSSRLGANHSTGTDGISPGTQQGVLYRYAICQNINTSSISFVTVSGVDFLL
ncbi:ubiquitin-like domain-containing protein CIP73 [Lycium ferocissimum]|uniref:ubiquitin-like domain-containing protein CIP73 n=1 Tax=Lycium ferocissimum TaxID=112874 RepID=UPI00281645D4|nr:ubiquitin-like domain-containing protein CIP73 [Lycium ferocissimum]